MESWAFNPAPAMASSIDRKHLHISLPSGKKDTDVYFDSKSLSRHHAQVWGEDEVRLVQLILCLNFNL
jgi:hypothetical protein